MKPKEWALERKTRKSRSKEYYYCGATFFEWSQQLIAAICYSWLNIQKNKEMKGKELITNRCQRVSQSTLTSSLSLFPSFIVSRIVDLEPWYRFVNKKDEVKKFEKVIITKTIIERKKIKKKMKDEQSREREGNIFFIVDVSVVGELEWLPTDDELAYRLVFLGVRLKTMCFKKERSKLFIIICSVLPRQRKGWPPKSGQASWSSVLGRKLCRLT